MIFLPAKREGSLWRVFYFEYKIKEPLSIITEGFLRTKLGHYRPVDGGVGCVIGGGTEGGTVLLVGSWFRHFNHLLSIFNTNMISGNVKK